MRWDRRCEKGGSGSEERDYYVLLDVENISRYDGYFDIAVSTKGGRGGDLARLVFLFCKVWILDFSIHRGVTIVSTEVYRFQEFCIDNRPIITQNQTMNGFYSLI